MYRIMLSVFVVSLKIVKLHLRCFIVVKIQGFLLVLLHRADQEERPLQG